jgi:drug/metabolite transporter (DMT)-like permease
MSSQTIAVLLGGLLPAVLFGVGTTLQKASNDSGISSPFYLGSLSIGFLLAAVSLYIYEPSRALSVRSGTFAILNGVLWGAAYCCMMFVLSKFQTPMSKLIPLVNMNTLVAVLLCFVVFSEWNQVNISKLLVGTVLIVVGGTLVANS